jgi:hypothetical protein
VTMCRWLRAGSAAGRPLPLARSEPVPPAPADVVYGIGRIDASGRIADQAVTSALGWRACDPHRIPQPARGCGIGVDGARDRTGCMVLPARGG